MAFPSALSSELTRNSSNISPSAISSSPAPSAKTAVAMKSLIIMLVSASALLALLRLLRILASTVELDASGTEQSALPAALKANT